MTAARTAVGNWGSADWGCILLHPTPAKKAHRTPQLDMSGVRGLRWSADGLQGGTVTLVPGAAGLRGSSRARRPRYRQPLQ